MFVPNEIKNNKKYYMSTINNIINNKNIIYGPYIKRCVFWFESNQWIPKNRLEI